MDSSTARGASRAGTLGTRNMSLGAAMKEIRAGRAGEGSSSAEYGVAGGSDGGDYPYDAKESKDMQGSAPRVVMMYDEDGKATPMPMAKFHYDSVRRDESEDDEQSDSLRQESGRDTVRSNVPAPFQAGKEEYSDSDSSAEDAGVARRAASKPFPDVRKPSAVIPESFVDDAEDYEYEDEEARVESAEDRFKNQFMRIEIPAAQLKDVSRVKKDVNHDKPHKRNSIMVGLQRAVSTVKIADGGRPRTSGSSGIPVSKQPSGARASLSKVGRMMSLSKDKSGIASKAANAENVSSLAPRPSGLERQRENTVSGPPRKKELAGDDEVHHATTSAASFGEARLPDHAEKVPDADRPRESRSIDRQPRQSHMSTKPSKRAGLAQVGRMMSFSRKKPAQNFPQTAAVRAGDGDVGNLGASLDRAPRESTSERQAHAPVRTSLAKMGRMMSLSRGKKQVPTQSLPESRKSDGKEAGVVPELSPISTSTVSSKAADSPASGNDRQSRGTDRGRPSSSSTGARKEPKRMTVQAAGRLLSFSRKPASNSGSDSRGRSLLAKEEDSLSKKEKSKRNLSGPAVQNDAEKEPGESSQKLDGRASKFEFIEINSERVRASASLGSDTHIRVPVIAMAEYSGPVSRTKWNIDGFTLPHNAVRRECTDLYDLLTGMATCKGDGDITRDDIDDFEDWWKTASSFFHCYFEMERTIMFPWVDAAGTKDWEVQTALKKMRSMKDRLKEHLVKIDVVWNETTFKDPGEMYVLVYRAVDEFVPRLMNYFADQEVLLPAIVRNFYRLEDRLKMDKEMVAIFMGGAMTRKNKEEPHHNLVLLIRWIGNARQLRAWIGKNLNSTARGLYGKWYSQFEEQHLRFVKVQRMRSKAILQTST